MKPIPFEHDHNCVIVDIDGTLANCEHRRVHITNGAKNWKAFNDLMEHDTPVPQIDRLVRVLNGSGYKIVLCSGREAAYRSVTEAWLKKWGITHHALYMRAEKDYRGDDVVKGELLDQILSDGYRPWFAIDDRNRVVDMWRSRGLTCLQCAPGDF